MSYGYAPAPRRSGMTTAGKWMFIVGLVLSLVAVGAMVWGGIQAANAAGALDEDGVPLTSPQTVTMSAGETRFVVAESEAAVSCTVTLPDGNEQLLEGSDLQDMGGMGGMGDDGSGMTLVGAHTAGDAGEHTFTCEGAGAQLSPPLGAGAFIAVAVLGIGFLALLPLGLLTIVGLVLWLVGRSRDKRALETPVGPGGPGHGHGYGPGPGYGNGSGYGPGPGSGYGPGPGSGHDSGHASGPGYGPPPGGPVDSDHPYGYDPRRDGDTRS